MAKDLEMHRRTGKAYKDQLEDIEKQASKLEETLMNEALKIPNFTHPDVPVGDKPNVLKQSEIPKFPTEIKDHLDIGKEFGLFDFESASKITGSKFVYLKNEAALLELALVNWAMKKISEKGFTPVITPDLAKIELARSCGFQPRDPSEQLYTVENSNLCLVGTSEIALAGLLSESLSPVSELPQKFGGFSHCFRVEAGKGAVSKGLYRLHQFSKVEMFAFCRKEESESIHQEMLEIQISIVEELGLAYRVLDMPTKDLGASAYRKYDVEVWMPGKKEWGEVTSTSNCTDYQAVRLNSFYQSGAQKTHLHTVNGTACAVPRILLSLLEYNQQQDNTILVPKCLHPYLSFQKIPSNQFKWRR